MLDVPLHDDCDPTRPIIVLINKKLDECRYRARFLLHAVLVQFISTYDSRVEINNSEGVDKKLHYRKYSFPKPTISSVLVGQELESKVWRLKQRARTLFSVKEPF